MPNKYFSKISRYREMTNFVPGISNELVSGFLF